MSRAITTDTDPKDTDSKESLENNGTHMTDMMEPEEEEVDTKSKDLERVTGDQSKLSTRRKVNPIQNFQLKKEKKKLKKLLKKSKKKKLRKKEPTDQTEEEKEEAEMKKEKLLNRKKKLKV